MTSNPTQVTVKRLACSNILGAEIPIGIKISFENFFCEILAEYTYLRHHNCVCVVVLKCLLVSF